MTDIESIRQEEQLRLDALKTAQERNRSGQFATPFALALEIAHYMKRLGGEIEPVRFLEPSIGTGVFYSALTQAFGPAQIAEAVGVEIDPQFALAARHLWIDTRLNIIEGDFTQLTPTHQFNLILANPP